MHERQSPSTPTHLVRLSANPASNVQPFEIEWNGRSYVVSSVSRFHRYQKGETVFASFLASDGIETFECNLSIDEYPTVIKQAKRINKQKGIKNAREN
jgi:hypothetical protein